jgi:hypothetical protein
MWTWTARALITSSCASALCGCSPPEPAAAPDPAPRAEHARDLEREQRELEQRRLKLQAEVLTELAKLRQSRQASTGAPQTAHDESPPPGGDEELLIFGGGSHEVFLGCLCDEHRSDSVFNLLGEHGSDASGTSIRDKFGPYGSNHDDTSACNASATRPPVVVASDGKSLGLLTLNPKLKRRISAPSVTDWLARMCGE